MSTAQLRREIKKAIDRMPTQRLRSVADYVSYLNRPSLTTRIAAARKAIRSGRGVNWHKVRSDV